MPDITACCNYDCPFRLLCYRAAVAEALPTDVRQSFAHFHLNAGGSCDDFLPIYYESNNTVEITDPLKWRK